jgi:hypothetical protein
MSDRRKDSRRKQGERKISRTAMASKLAEELRMQARVKCAANRVSKVPPTEPEKTLEWKVALFLEGNDA